MAESKNQTVLEVDRNSSDEQSEPPSLVPQFPIQSSDGDTKQKGLDVPRTPPDGESDNGSDEKSLEAKNFFCLLRLAIEFGTKVLREILDKIYPPYILRDKLQDPSIKNALKVLRSKKILASAQWFLLYPSSTETDPTSSSMYDVSLLLILLRNICDLKAPSNGWNSMPSPDDTSLEADIVRIGLFRNKYAHAGGTFSVSDAEFETQWSEIVSLLVRQGGEKYMEETQKLKEKSSEVENERYYRELFFVKVDVNKLIQGQVELQVALNEIQNKIQETPMLTSPSTGNSDTSPNSETSIDQTTAFVHAMERDTNIEKGLALLLDHEYLVVKNWKHLADLLKVPIEIKEACKRDTAHSPSLTIFSMPDIIDKSKSELIKTLKDIGRKDLADILNSEKIQGNTLEDILSKDRELLDKISCKLDIARSPVKGWYELGLALKIERGVLDAINRRNNPAKTLFLHVYKTLPDEEKTVGKSRIILNKLKRRDIQKLLDMYGIKENVEEPLENLLPPESDKMRQLCSLLNKSLYGAIKCWKELAYEWGIPHPVYSAFDPTEKASPTISLLEWVKSNLSGTLTVGQLCKHLKDIERYDAHEFLQKQIDQTSATRQDRE